MTDDVAKAVTEAKRIVKLNKKDKAAVVHAGVGKVQWVSFVIWCFIYLAM